MNDPFAANGTGRSMFPRGWYLVCWSTDLERGGVRPLRYFGKDYVLFRGDDGKATLLSAHCPHLGAHLGYGGRVDGNDIICPFHAWRFGASGRCTESEARTQCTAAVCVVVHATAACWAASTPCSWISR